METATMDGIRIDSPISIRPIEMPLAKPKYCLYARKSTEDDERQALSIDSQIKEMLQLAEKEGLEIAEIRREAHSAKESGARPVFKQLLDDIEVGMFNGILTWAPDRLSRNAGDLGRIVDLMDQGRLVDIRTHGQRFTNNPQEKFLLMILISGSKMENDTKGVNVKRGLRTKCEMGIRPGCVPIGYKLIRNSENFREPSKIIVDEERAPFVKKMFEYLNSGLSGRQVNDYLTDEGFRTNKGKPLTMSMTFRMLKSTFYYGEFKYPAENGTWYKGSHTPLITKEEFNKAQKQLRTFDKGVWGRKEFYFNKVFKCGSCGSFLCGVDHVNRHGKLYTYYKCHGYGGRVKCKEKHIREENLIASVAKSIEQIKDKHLHLERKLHHEVEKVNELQKLTLGDQAGTITIQNYIEYILKNGTKTEKGNLLRYLDGQLILKGGEVTLSQKSLV